MKPDALISPKQQQASCIMHGFLRTKLLNFPPGPPGTRLPALKCGSSIWQTPPSSVAFLSIDLRLIRNESHFTISIPIALGDEDVQKTELELFHSPLPPRVQPVSSDPSPIIASFISPTAHHPSLPLLSLPAFLRAPSSPSYFCLFCTSPSGAQKGSREL